MSYKLLKDFNKFYNINPVIETHAIKRLSDGAFIPLNPDNTDYQEYLEWTKASPMNVALPADEVTE